MSPASSTASATRAAKNHGVAWRVIPPRSALFERRHRQPRLAQELPVVLGGLPRTAPDDRLAGVVDPVGDREALLVGDARNDARQRRGDALERVVVVVQD